MPRLRRDQPRGIRNLLELWRISWKSGLTSLGCRHIYSLDTYYSTRRPGNCRAEGEHLSHSGKFNPNLVRGSIDLVVLAAVANGEKYGYLILKRLREASGDRHEIQAGTLYPILHRLEHDGAISSRWEEVGERRRKWYAVTDKGMQMLREQAGLWHAFSEYVNGVLATALRPT